MVQQEMQDPAVQRAIALLAEGDRPTVPVRLYDDPDKVYDEALKKFGGPKLSPNAVGVVPFDKSAIYINKKSKEYGDPYTLASKLAHEQVHVKAPNWDRRESPAYQKELEFVDANQIRFDKQYRAALIQTLKQMEKEKR